MIALMSRFEPSVIVLVLPIPFAPRIAGPLTLLAPCPQLHAGHDAVPGAYRLETHDPGVNPGRLDGVRRSRLAGDDYIIANLNMACDAHVASDHAARPDTRAAGHTSAAGDGRVSSDVDV